MKAIVAEHRGGAALKEIPVPQPGPDEILARVTVAGVNLIDWKLRDARMKNRNDNVIYS